MYPATEIKIALQALLGYNRTNERSPDRRCFVIRHLNAGCSVERFRRDDGPERQLLTILAEHLYPGEAAAA
jgi:hypothetical protein